MTKQLIDVTRLPTPLAAAANRLNVVGAEASADTFLAASYIFEVFLKLVVVALHAGLAARHREHAYRLAYNLLRADGLGTWLEAFQELTAQPIVGFLPPEFGTLLVWATKRRTRPEDEWARQAFEEARQVLTDLGADLETPIKLTISHVLSACIQIRNKTKAHGAVGEDFFHNDNCHYINALRGLIANCPVLSWGWLRTYRSPPTALRGVILIGMTPERINDTDVRASDDMSEEGVFCIPEKARKPFAAGVLLQSDRRCRSFFFPNGGLSKTRAEFLDYTTGQTKPFDVSGYILPPAPLPPSETHSEFSFDIQSNVFGNLPPLPERYVERPTLQAELLTRLKDRNHAIITLHGRGGVGKTYLALYAAHTLAAMDVPPFEYILWLSARDIDLRTRGPATVCPDVVTLDEICRAFGRLFGIDGDLGTFAAVLQDPTPQTKNTRGMLFILDNFETLADITEIHRFLDTHTHSPNKVLITSRERAFKADYPIEVRGMEFGEAREMLRRTADELGIRYLMDDERVRELYEYTDGHAYAMRVIAGEMAKEGRRVPLKSILPKRLDIVQAIFERSFNKLTDAGRRVFLVVGGLKSLIAELPLLVILGQRDIDVESGIDECVRLSLIEDFELADGTDSYVAPQLARIFAQKKLEGDPDRLVIQEDVESIREFGIVKPSQRGERTQEHAVRSFVDYCLTRAKCDTPEARDRVAEMLEAVAELWPNAWLALFEFLERYGGNDDDKARALRRAVEELPSSKQSWLERAAFAEHRGDEQTFIASLVSAVEADPDDVQLIREVAFQLSKYVNAHLHEIPKARRGVYLASVRSRMEKVAAQLDATGLSRLAWLFLLEDDQEDAWKYANMGCEKDSTNSHCISILQRLEEKGYRP